MRDTWEYNVHWQCLTPGMIEDAANFIPEVERKELLRKYELAAGLVDTGRGGLPARLLCERMMLWGYALSHMINIRDVK